MKKIKNLLKKIDDNCNNIIELNKKINKIEINFNNINNLINSLKGKGYYKVFVDDEIIDIDEDELTEFVLKNTKKDKLKEFSADEITFIIQGELAYCESINLFE